MKKSLCCVILAMVLLVSSLPVTLAQAAGTLTPTDVPPTTLSYGDTNGDQKIDAKDALNVLIFSVTKYVPFPHENPTPEELERYQKWEWSKKIMDVDGDKIVNAKDALLILKYSVKKISKFPVEEIAVTPTNG